MRVAQDLQKVVNIVQKKAGLRVAGALDEMLRHDHEAAARPLQVAGQQCQHQPVRWVAVKGLEAVQGVLFVKIEVSDVVSAGGIARGAAAGEGGLRGPVARFHGVVFEELDGEKGDGFHRFNLLNIDVQQSKIAPVQGVVGSLEAEDFQCQRFEARAVEDLKFLEKRCSLLFVGHSPLNC